MTTTFTAFDLMVLQLGGQPAPALPTIAGRIYAAPKPSDSDPRGESWDRASALLFAKRAPYQFRIIGPVRRCTPSQGTPT